MKWIIIALILLSTVSAKAELIHHLAFDETSGQTAFNSVSGTNGTILGGVVVDQDGKIGKAYEFDGTNTSLVEMDNYKGILGTTSRTVNIWIKTPAEANTSEVELIYWGLNDDGAYWHQHLQADGKVNIRVYGGDMYSLSTVTNDIWRMFTVVLQDDGSPNIDEVKIYIDGTNGENGWTGEGIDTGAGDDVRVGKGYTGLLDDFALWNEVLNQDEITCLYDAAQIGYNAHHFDQLKTLHDDADPEGRVKPLDEWWEYASDLTGSLGLNSSGEKKWFIFGGDGGAGNGTGARLAASGTCIIIR